MEKEQKPAGKRAKPRVSAAASPVRDNPAQNALPDAPPRRDASGTPEAATTAQDNPAERASVRDNPAQNALPDAPPRRDASGTPEAASTARDNPAERVPETESTAGSRAERVPETESTAGSRAAWAARIGAYFDACDATRERVTQKNGSVSERQIPYTLCGLGCALGLKKGELLGLAAGGTGWRNRLAAQALQRIAAYTMERALLGELSCQMAAIALSELGGAPGGDAGAGLSITMDETCRRLSQ